MDIHHDENRQRFNFATPDGDAVVDYEREGDTVVFTHTYVPPSQRGKGIAEKLVKTALDWADAQRLQSEASCSYVALWLQKRRRAQTPAS